MDEKMVSSTECWDRTVVVEGFDSEITEDIIELLFEDFDETGGGDIDEIVMDAGASKATIVFQEEEVAARVLERSHVISDVPVTVSRPARPQQTGFTSVEVHGLKSIHSESILRTFFSKKTKSDGGPIDCVVMQPEHKMAIITFRSSEDADCVVQRGVYTLGGCELVVQEASTSQPPKVPVLDFEETRIPTPADKETTSVKQEMTFNSQSFESPRAKPVEEPVSPVSSPSKAQVSTVQVSGIPPHIPQQFLELFFENPRQSGGGPLSNIEYTQGSGQALVTFQNSTDALNVLLKGTMPFEKVMLRVGAPPSVSSGYRYTRDEDTQASPTPTTDEFKQVSAEPALSTVQVTGIPPGSSRDFVKLFLEDKRCGNGPIAHIDYTEGGGKAVVTFENAADAERLVKTNPQMDGSQLSIRLLDSSVLNETPFAIVISNICPTVPEQTLELYFESKRSGGSEIQDLEFDVEKRTAVITYSDPKVVDEILARQPHSLGNQPLHLFRPQPAALVPIVRGPVVEDALFVKGIPPNCDLQTLTVFLEKHSRTALTNVIYGIQVPYVALVVFKQNVDYGHIKRMCARYPLKGSLVAVQQVEKFTSVQVHGIKGMNPQYLQLYFESNRYSGGGEIQPIQDYGESDWTVIQFEHIETFRNVMKRDTHVFEGYDMKVRPYIPELGVLPPGHNHSAPPKPVPASITWKGMDQRVMGFLMKSEENRSIIEQDLRQVGAIVRWPQTSSELPQLESCLNQDDSNFSQSYMRWKEQVARIAENYTAVEMSISPTCWDDCVRRLKTLKFKQVDCKINRTGYLVLLVGQRSGVEETREILAKMQRAVS